MLHAVVGQACCTQARCVPSVALVPLGWGWVGWVGGSGRVSGGGGGGCNYGTGSTQDEQVTLGGAAGAA